MEARILQWQELAKNRIQDTVKFDQFQEELRRLEFEKRRDAQIQDSIAKVPVRFSNKIFADYKTAYPAQLKIKHIAEKFIETFEVRLATSFNLHFFGMPGTGKTLLSLIMYQSIAKLGYSVQYESSTQFIRLLQEKKYASTSAYNSIINHYKNIDFLILDEITESITKDCSLSEIDRKLLFDVINARYEDGKCCTLIISNRAKLDVIKRLGEPIFSRLSENSISLIFNWNSYRQNQGETRC